MIKTPLVLISSSAKLAVNLSALPKIILGVWPYLALVIAHLIWGGNFIVAKLALAEIPPMILAFMRFFCALILLLPFLILERKNTIIEKQDLPRFFLVGILMVTLNIAFFYEGLSRTTAISASVLTMIIPIFSVLMGWWFLKEHIYLINLGGITLGLIGSLFILEAPQLLVGDTLSFPVLMGNLLIILASIVWVIGAVISKKLLAKYSTLTLTAFIFLVGALTFAIPALTEYLSNPLWPTKVTSLGILGLVYITVLSSVSAYFLFEWGLNKLGVIKADLFQYIEPLVAASLAILVLSETPKVIYLIGGILVAVGVYLSTIAKDQHRHSKAHRH